MRKVEKQMLAALRCGGTVTNAGKNTSVSPVNGVTLFGNRIIWRYDDELRHLVSASDIQPHWVITLAGYATNTTKSRINAFLSAFMSPNRASIGTEKGRIFLHHNGVKHEINPCDKIYLSTGGQIAYIERFP